MLAGASEIYMYIIRYNFTNADLKKEKNNVAHVINLHMCIIRGNIPNFVSVKMLPLYSVNIITCWGCH